jgi:hypothetical protein
MLRRQLSCDESGYLPTSACCHEKALHNMHTLLIG